MNEIQNTVKEKDRIRTYNFRLRKRQLQFAGNRPEDYVAPLDRTLRTRKQKASIKKKKNLTVEPLSSKPLHSVENNNDMATGTNNVPVSEAGDVGFDANGMLIEESIVSTATLTAPTTNTMNSGARPKTTEYQNVHGGNNPLPSPHSQIPPYNNIDPLGIRNINLNSRYNNPWNQYDLSYRPLSVESVNKMIVEAQEKSMPVMMQKFDQLLKLQQNDTGHNVTVRTNQDMKIGRRIIILKLRRETPGEDLTGIIFLKNLLKTTEELTLKDNGIQVRYSLQLGPGLQTLSLSAF